MIEARFGPGSPCRDRAVAALALVLGACGGTPAPADFGWFERLGAVDPAVASVVLPTGWSAGATVPRAETTPRAGDALLYLARLDDGSALVRLVAVTVLATDLAREVAQVAVEVFDEHGHSLGSSEHALPIVHLANGLHSAAVELHAGTARLEPEELSPVVAGVRSLQALLELIEDAPLLSPLLWRVVEKPSLWSVITHLGVEPSITLGAAVEAAAPLPHAPAPALRTPLLLALNGATALRCSIVSVPPRAPYSAGAGIVALVAERPDASRARFELRVLAARSVLPRGQREP